MTAHVFQVFLDDAPNAQSSEQHHRHLAPGGRLVFESRNPLVREWESWTMAETRETRQISGIGSVEVYYQVTMAQGELVTFDAVFTLLDTGRGASARARCALPPMPNPPTADAGGFSQIENARWWDGSPFQSDSREIIVTAYA